MKNHKKNLSILNSINMFLINLSLCLFISLIIFYQYSLNATPLLIISILFVFIVFFYLSYILTEKLFIKFHIKNIIIISKLTLGITTFYAALLIYNKFGFNSGYKYLAIIGTAISWALLNKTYVKLIKNKENENSLNKLLFQFNLKIILIIIFTISSFYILEVKYIPLILILTSVYYFLSGYIDTFQNL